MRADTRKKWALRGIVSALRWLFKRVPTTEQIVPSLQCAGNGVAMLMRRH